MWLPGRPTTGASDRLADTPLRPPDPVCHTDANTAARLRTALTWIRTIFAIVPLAIAPRESEGTLGHNAAQAANEFAAPLLHPNAIATVDHGGGVAAFRWFLADQVPARPIAVPRK